MVGEAAIFVFVRQDRQVEPGLRLTHLSDGVLVLRVELGMAEAEPLADSLGRVLSRLIVNQEHDRSPAFASPRPHWPSKTLFPS